MVFGTSSSIFDEERLKFHSFVVGIDRSKHYFVHVGMQGEASDWFSAQCRISLSQLPRIETELDIVTLVTRLDTLRICKGCQPSKTMPNIQTICGDRGVADYICLGKGVFSLFCWGKLDRKGNRVSSKKKLCEQCRLLSQRLLHYSKREELRIYCGGTKRITFDSDLQRVSLQVVIFLLTKKQG